MQGYADASGAPPATKDSPDWGLRAPFDPRITRDGCHQDRRVWDNLLRWRLSYTTLHYPIAPGLDIAYVRRREEYQYSRRIRAIHHEDIEKMGADRLAKLIRYQCPRVLPGRLELPLADISQEGVTTSSMISTPHSWAQAERRMHARTGAFMAAQYQESVAVTRYYIPTRYLTYPVGWEEREVPFCLALRIPQCITYKSFCLLRHGDCGDASGVCWDLFEAEWTLECLVESIYSCRRG